MMNLDAFSALVVQIICAMNFGTAWLSATAFGVSIPTAAFCQPTSFSISANPNHVLPDDHFMVYYIPLPAEVYIPQSDPVVIPSLTTTTESNDARLAKMPEGHRRVALATPDWATVFEKLAATVSSISTKSADHLRQAYSDVDGFARSQQPLVDQAKRASSRAVAKGWSYRKIVISTVAIVSMLWIVLSSVIARDYLHSAATKLIESVEPGLTGISTAFSNVTDVFLYLAAAVLHILCGIAIELIYRAWCVLAAGYRETQSFLQSLSAQDQYDFGRAIARAMEWGFLKGLWALVEAARCYFVIQYQIADSVAWYMKHGILWVVAQFCRFDYSMALIIRQKDKLQALRAENAFLKRRSALPVQHLQHEINLLREANAIANQEVSKNRANYSLWTRQYDQLLEQLNDARRDLERKSSPTPQTTDTPIDHARNIVIGNRSRILAKQVTAETEDGQPTGAEFLGDLLIYVHKYDRRLYEDVMGSVASHIGPPPTQLTSGSSSTRPAPVPSSVAKEDNLSKAKLLKPTSQTSEPGRVSGHTQDMHKDATSIPVAQRDSTAKLLPKADRLPIVKPSESTSTAAGHEQVAGDVQQVTKSVGYEESEQGIEKPIAAVSSLPSPPRARDRSPLKSSLKPKTLPQVKLPESTTTREPEKSVSFHPQTASARDEKVVSGLKVSNVNPRKRVPKASKETDGQTDNSVTGASGGGSSQPESSELTANTIVGTSNTLHAIPEAISDAPDKMDVDVQAASSSVPGPIPSGTYQPENSEVAKLVEFGKTTTPGRPAMSPFQSNAGLTWRDEMDLSGSASTAAPATAPSQPLFSQIPTAEATKAASQPSSSLFQSPAPFAAAPSTDPTQPWATQHSFGKPKAAASTQTPSSGPVLPHIPPAQAAPAAPAMGPGQTWVAQLPFGNPKGAGPKGPEPKAAAPQTAPSQPLLFQSRPTQQPTGQDVNMEDAQTAAPTPSIGPAQPWVAQLPIGQPKGAEPQAAQTAPPQPSSPPQSTPTQQPTGQDVDMEDAQAPIASGPSSLLPAPGPAPESAMTGIVSTPGPAPESALTGVVATPSVSNSTGFLLKPRSLKESVIPTKPAPITKRKLGTTELPEAAQHTEPDGQKSPDKQQNLQSDTTMFDVADINLSEGNESMASGSQETVQAQIGDTSATASWHDQPQPLPYNLGLILEDNQSHGFSQAAPPNVDLSAPIASTSAASDSTSALPGLRTIPEHLIDPTLRDPQVMAPPASVFEDLRRKADAWAVASENETVEAVCGETLGDTTYLVFVQQAISDYDPELSLSRNLKIHAQANNDLVILLSKLLEFKCEQLMLKTTLPEKAQLKEENMSWLVHVGGTSGYNINWKRVDGLAEHRFVYECVQRQKDISQVKLDAELQAKYREANSSDEELYDDSEVSGDDDRPTDREESSSDDESPKDRIHRDVLKGIYDLMKELSKSPVKDQRIDLPPGASKNVKINSNGTMDFSKCTKHEGHRCLKHLLRLVARDVKWPKLSKQQQVSLFSHSRMAWFLDGIIEASRMVSRTSFQFANRLQEKYDGPPPWDEFSLGDLKLFVDLIDDALCEPRSESISDLDEELANEVMARFLADPESDRIMVDDSMDEGAQRAESGHTRAPETAIPGLTFSEPATSPTYGSSSQAGFSAYTVDRTVNHDHARMPAQSALPPQASSSRQPVQRSTLSTSNSSWFPTKAEDGDSDSTTSTGILPSEARQSAGHAQQQAGTDQQDEMVVDNGEEVQSIPVHLRPIMPLRRRRRRLNL